jgi:hypothetical protein
MPFHYTTFSYGTVSHSLIFMPFYDDPFIFVKFLFNNLVSPPRFLRPPPIEEPSQDDRDPEAEGLLTASPEVEPTLLPASLDDTILLPERERSQSETLPAYSP